MTYILPALALSAALLTSAPAAAQDHSDQVYRQLHERYRVLKSSGKALRLERTIINAVGADVSDDWTFYFDASRRYAVLAACDGDCADIDLKIVDPDTGEALAEDRAEDATPLVTFVPEASGRYEVSVKMFDCGADYCYAGFAIYSY